MRLAVDTSVIIAVIGNEPEKPALIAATQGYDLVAPRSLPWELGNAFSAMLKRNRITFFAALVLARHVFLLRGRPVICFPTASEIFPRRGERFFFGHIFIYCGTLKNK